MRADSVRLLTLTGPGGVGKTRLAIEVARTVESDFRDGAAFVSLAAVRQAEEVPAAIVGTLEITLMPGEPAAAAVERYLGDRQLLLVADNFEHVLDAAPFVAGLLDACPALTVLATSREPLALAAEERVPVAPIAAADAIALFTERARAIDPGFALDERGADAVTDICRRLDGLPLAIELAAARCGLLSPAELAERLGDALGALGEGARDAPARQRTLRATIEWSHDLLSEDEQAAFAHFAVFAGAPDLEAAEAITGARLDTLDRLLAKSLLVRRRAARSTTRLAMLETIRAYAAERLAARSDDEAVRERHFGHYLAVAERHGTDRALWGTGHRAHLAELDAAIDDFHAALGWAVRRPGGHEALRLCAGLAWYWLARDSHGEALRWSEQALSLPSADADAVLRARVLCLVGACLWGLGRAGEQPPILAEAEALARSHADPVQLARLLESRAVFASGVGQFDVADTYAEEALSLAGTDDWTCAMAARASVLAAPPGALLHERADRAVALLERAGNHFHLASMLASAAYGALGEGNAAAAMAYIERAVPIARELDNPHMWMLVRGNAAMAALLAGDVEAARSAFRDELRLSRELGFLPFVFEGLRGLAAIAAADGDPDRAARLCGAAERHRHDQPDDAPHAQLDATFLDAARARCGADAWEAAFRDGARAQRRGRDRLRTPHPTVRRLLERSRPGADRDQVLHLEARGAGRAAVPLVAELVEHALELGLAAVAPGVALRGDGGPVTRLEVLGEVMRPREGGDRQRLSPERVQVDAVAEELAHVLLAAPQRRRLRAGRRRRGERAHGAEQRADLALGRPAQEPDPPARRAHAHELVRDGLVVRREHRTDRRHHDVVGLVRERQVLGIGLDPLELDARDLGAAAPGLEQLGRQVAGGHARAALRRRDRGVAGAGGDVEDAHAALDAARLDEARAQREQERLDHRG